MRPTPIPDSYVGPGARRMVMAAPGGDLTSTAVSAVEVLAYDGEDGTKYRSVRVVLEQGDLEALTAGRPVWLIFMGETIVPFAIGVEGDTRPGEG